MRCAGDDPKKRLLDLKKRLASGELGMGFHSVTYTHPSEGADAFATGTPRDDPSKTAVVLLLYIREAKLALVAPVYLRRGLTRLRSPLLAALERAIRRDWLAGVATEHGHPPRLIAMQDAHRSFALDLVDHALPLGRNKDAEARVEAWINANDVLGVGVAPFICHGSPGSGMSAFLATMWRKMDANRSLDSALLHFREVDKMVCNLLTRTCAMLGNLIPGGSDLEPPIGYENQMKEFVRLQGCLGRTQRVCIVLDGCIDMENEKGEEIKLMEDLPYRMSASMRVLIGIPTGTKNLKIPTLRQWPCYELLPLSKSDQVTNASMVMLPRSNI